MLVFYFQNPDVLAVALLLILSSGTSVVDFTDGASPIAYIYIRSCRLSRSVQRYHYCIGQGQSKFSSFYFYFQLKIIIIIINLMNFCFSVIIINFFFFTGFNQMKKWQAWELETNSLEYQFTNGECLAQIGPRGNQIQVVVWATGSLTIADLIGLSLTDPARFRFTHQTSFVKRHSGLSRTPGIRWIVSFKSPTHTAKY